MGFEFRGSIGLFNRTGVVSVCRAASLRLLQTPLLPGFSRSGGPHRSCEQEHRPAFAHTLCNARHHRSETNSLSTVQRVARVLGAHHPVGQHPSRVVAKRQTLHHLVSQEQAGILRTFSQGHQIEGQGRSFKGYRPVVHHIQPRLHMLQTSIRKGLHLRQKRVNHHLGAFVRVCRRRGSALQEASRHGDEPLKRTWAD